MPLLMISGFPKSGKTHRAHQIEEHYKSKLSALQSSASAQPAPRLGRLKVHYISDDALSIARSAYGTAQAEKTARAAFYSAVKRALGPDDIVIADGLNYIKGFRYQLYCEAKAMGTPSCVIHVGTPAATCREMNDAAASSDPQKSYSGGDFENLIQRYEEPNGMTRWDSPLFTIVHDDPDPPYDAIWEAMIGSSGGGGRGSKAVKPHQATVLKPATSSSYLYELDRATQDITSRILAYQNDHPDDIGGGGRIDLSTPASSTSTKQQSLQGSTTAIELPAGQPVTLPQLQRLRRQFINMHRQHNQQQGAGVADPGRIADLFVDFLNGQFEGL